MEILWLFLFSLLLFLSPAVSSQKIDDNYDYVQPPDKIRAEVDPTVNEISNDDDDDDYEYDYVEPPPIPDSVFANIKEEHQHAVGPNDETNTDLGRGSGTTTGTFNSIILCINLHNNFHHCRAIHQM
jgi:hypothetical protein